MALNISGLLFFMPVFSFLFVFLIIFALLTKTKIIGESKFVLVLISFIISIIFMSFSSAELYIRTILPWFVVLMVIVFLVLMIAMFSTKAWDKIFTPAFAWVIVGILILMFLIAAIYVFNPVLHSDLGVTSGQGTSMIEQIRTYLDGGVAGSILLLIVAIVVAWIITKK
jgi:hypothetical protein